LILIGIVCFGRALVDKGQHDASWKAALTYCLLVVSLVAVALARTQIAVGN
jgi:hypothetical protein